MVCTLAIARANTRRETVAVGSDREDSEIGNRRAALSLRHGGVTLLLTLSSSSAFPDTCQAQTLCKLANVVRALVGCGGWVK